MMLAREVDDGTREKARHYEVILRNSSFTTTADARRLRGNRRAYRRIPRVR